MQDDRWKDSLDRIEERFTIEETGETLLDDIPGGKVEFVVFTSPVGRVRLERVTKPRTIGERAMGSRRIGGDTTVEKIYDQNDLVHFLRGSRWDEAQRAWIEIEIDAGAFTS
jgi:hypothetical protein